MTRTDDGMPLGACRSPVSISKERAVTSSEDASRRGAEPGGPGHPDLAPPPPTLRRRIQTLVHRDALTGALATGADAQLRPELQLRARQLTRRRKRRALARSLRRALQDARRPFGILTRAVLIRREPVIAAADVITALAARLDGELPVRAEGVARVERLLSNADRSPLYNHSRPGALRAALLGALRAMDPLPPETHEFGLAA